MYTFQEIRGNRPLVEQLKTAADSGKVSHAYLFLGGAGAGKRLIANTFAKALQCEAAGNLKPCGQCRSCQAFDNSNHPDIIYVRGEKKNLLVDDIREQILETVEPIGEGTPAKYQESFSPKVISLLKTLYRKREEKKELGKKFHIADERVMKEAEQLLHGEFAYVLGIGEEQVLPYIFGKLK